MVRLGFAVGGHLPVLGTFCEPSWRWCWLLLGARFFWAGHSLEEQGSCSAGVGSDHSNGESAACVVLTDSPAVSPWAFVTQGAS